MRVVEGHDHGIAAGLRQVRVLARPVVQHALSLHTGSLPQRRAAFPEAARAPPSGARAPGNVPASCPELRDRYPANPVSTGGRR
ncbi:hypothetical protein GCM10022247_12550 [Allokutzneria multivorans]|uniref:Uncharacterized protein n=1 Tax=Allokutzneria multivorans TaxID=1142134 RepID=A0ABP7RA26_9PSEU